MTLPEFLEYVKAGGAPLAIVFAILWWLERDERRDTQAEQKQQTKDTLTTMAEMKALLHQVVTIFKPGSGQK